MTVVLTVRTSDRLVSKGSTFKVHIPYRDLSCNYQPTNKVSERTVKATLTPHLPHFFLFGFCPLWRETEKSSQWAIPPLQERIPFRNACRASLSSGPTRKRSLSSGRAPSFQSSLFFFLQRGAHQKDSRKACILGRRSDQHVARI